MGLCACEGAGVCVQGRVVMVSYAKGRGQSQLRINHPHAYTHSPTQHTHNRLARNHGLILNTEVASCKFEYLSSITKPRLEPVY